MVFLFTFKSGSLPNRRPSPLPELGLFLSVFLPGFLEITIMGMVYNGKKMVTTGLKKLNRPFSFAEIC